jgi:beta-glucosidase
MHWKYFDLLVSFAFVGTALLAPAAIQAQAVDGLSRSMDPTIEKRVDKLIGQMTLDEKIDLIGGLHRFQMHPIERLGIPGFVMADGPVGAHVPQPGVAYAGGIGLAASWDRKLAYDMGVQLGRDSKSRGASFLLGPGVNIYREPMNGRNFEYFGEDPYLGSAIAVGYIHGIQSQSVSATVKHYLGNNSEYARHTTDAIIGERALREIYMPIFEAAVKQGHVGAIMNSYNLTNGEHMTQNAYLNVDVAKNEWKFPGMIMSDWNSVYSTVAAFNGGLDLEMPFSIYFDRPSVHDALDKGEVSVATLDDKVRRILRVAATFGWLDHTSFDPLIPRYNLQGRSVSHQAVLEGSVLLKNAQGVLPLDESQVKRLAIIGPNGAQTQTTGGGSGEVVSFAPTSLVAGFATSLAGKADVLYSRGLYSAAQLAALTNFSLDKEGKSTGVFHETFPGLAIEGTPIKTITEFSFNLGGNARRDVDEQEIIQLKTTRSSIAPPAPPTSDRFTAFYRVETAGNYLTFVQTSHCYRLLVDDKPVFDSSVLSKAILAQTHIKLTQGIHKVVLEVFGGDRSSELRFPLLIGFAPVDKLVDPQTLEIASKSDAVILSVGFNSGSESEGGDRGFDLPLGQDELIEKVAALGKKTIVIVNGGGSVNVSPWLNQVGALIQSWYPGEDGGSALEELVFGKVNPAGHLPISWERDQADNPSFTSYYPQPGTHTVEYRDGIFVGYRGYDHLHTKPLFPFGFGLSYTTFQFSGINLTATPDGHAKVSFTVKNTGTRRGDTVAQAYVGKPSSTVERPEKELKAFDRVSLNAGESRVITLMLDPRAFAYFDVTSKDWKVETGAYTIRVGDSSDALTLSGNLTMPRTFHIPVAE